MPPVILKGAAVLIDAITIPDSGQRLLLKGEAADVAAAPAQDLKEALAGQLGELLKVRLVEVLSPETFLLEVAGSEVVARGTAPPGTEAVFTVRLESLEPLVSFSLADLDENGLPLELRRLLSEVVAKPNLFSKDLLALRELLADEANFLPDSLRKPLNTLLTRFSAPSLIADMRSGAGLSLVQLGLFHEPGLAELLLNNPEKIARLALREPLTSKETLLQLRAQLEGRFLEDMQPKGGLNDSKMVAHLRSTIRSLLDSVELNQALNNAGLKNDDGFILLLPLWGWGSNADLWLRLKRDREAHSSGDNLYTLMIYLDLEGLGPLGAQVVVGSRELQVKLLVSGSEAAVNLRELLPEARKSLRSDFPGGVGLTVETIGLNGLEEFRQRAFLASFPALFSASG